MLFGTNLTYTKAFNYRIVFETIRLHGTISRAEIARLTNLTAQTVSNIVSRLLERNIVIEGHKLQNGRGAPSVTLEVNPGGAYSIGLDLNRDHLTGILVDLSGNVKTKIYYEVDSPSPNKAIELMASTVNQLLESKELGSSQFCGIGIGFPGPLEISPDNALVSTVNPKTFPNWEHVPVVKMLKNHIDVPIYLENNASAATIGERWYGIGKNISNFYYAFFGAGLGGGLVINGDLYEGYKRNAGEIGYIPFSGTSPLCTSNAPHIGEHFNLSRLYAWLKEFGIDVYRPEDLARLFDTKEPHFMSWLDKAKEMLVPAFLAIEYIMDPEMFIIGGRLPKNIVDHLCVELSAMMFEKRIIEKEYFPKFQGATAGADAAALGAATLPMFDLFAAQTQVLIKNK